MSHPLLSIVIANYNYGRFLEEAIQSVIAQDVGDQVELIICDAESTDNSVDIIKKYANGLPPNVSYSDWVNSCNANSKTPPLITWWCSEPDGGQSAAFNKGFSHATGRFLTWLNADDVLLPGVLKKLLLAIEQHPSCEWFVGGVLWLDPMMNIIKCARARNFSQLRYKCGNVSVWGPSSFFTKQLLEKVGGVDERLHYTMDTDLWLRFVHKVGVHYRPFADYAWGLRMHPDAKMSGHNFTNGTYIGGVNGTDITNDRKVMQLMREKRWRYESFTPMKQTRLIRLLSVSWRQYVAGCFDTWRWRGLHYRTCISR